jgi:hypothetical protein
MRGEAVVNEDWDRRDFRPLSRHPRMLLEIRQDLVETTDQQVDPGSRKETFKCTPLVFPSD